MNLMPFIAVGDSAASTPPDPQDTTPVLIPFFFESNSGGMVLNTNCSVGELTTTPLVKTLNPLTLAFEDMQIGVNVNLQHFGITPNTTHGWHLGIKIRQEAGTFIEGNRVIYICEGGQGGSILASWNEMGDYYTKLVARMDAAVAAIVAETGQQPRIFPFVSHGINDALAANPASYFKQYELELLDRIDARYGIEAYFMDIIPAAYSTYRAVIQEMADERNNIYLQDMDGKQMMDPNHLGYTGMKDQTYEKIDALLELL